MDTIKITLEVPRYHVVETRAGASAKIDIGAIPQALYVDLFENGLSQKRRDGMSSAARSAAIDHFGEAEVGDRLTKAQAEWIKNTPEGQDMLRKHQQAFLDDGDKQLLAGVWSQRGSGTGTSGIRSFAILRLFRAVLASPELAKSAGITTDAKAFKKLTASEQTREALAHESLFDEEAIAGMVAMIEQERAEKAERDRIEAEQLAKLVGGLKLNV